MMARVWHAFRTMKFAHVTVLAFAQVGASDPVKRLVAGAVIVLAVVADGLRKRAD